MARIRIKLTVITVGILALCALLSMFYMQHEVVRHDARLAQVRSAPKTHLSASSSALANKCEQNTESKLLLVSVSQQRIWACEASKLVNQSPVTTGTTQIVNGVDSSTPVGTWHIYQKQTDKYLKGCDANGCWNDYVQYWMPFDGEVGFHDASWQTFPFGTSNYHTDGSHGCVHLPIAVASWVYSWASIGTTVTVEA